MADERWIIVGLGNPGPEYAAPATMQGPWSCPARRADRRQVQGAPHPQRHRRGPPAGQPVTLARPHSYMNLSGGPVAALLGFYKLSPERVVVIHDELDVPFGAVRLKLGGGDNGHNGLRSITSSLGTRDYYRVRFGIGRPPGRMDPPPSCSRTSRRRSARNCPSRSTAPPTRRKPCYQGPGRGPERVPHRPGLTRGA